MKRPGRRIWELMQNQSMGDETLPGIPIIEISGDRRVLIEQHQGVVAYGCQEIRVRVKYGLVSVTGSGLRLARMTGDQIVICGCVNGIQLVKSGR